jgi:hypothetical protein
MHQNFMKEVSDMRGRTATEILATRSARELPMAKMVRPMIAFERPKMKPKVYKHLVSV